MKNLILKEKDLLGSGNERTCYIHPNDPKKCVKVTKKRHRDQNRIESMYFSRLNKRNIPFNHIPIYYGEKSTNYGSGLVFERILNEDNSQAIRFDKAIKKGCISLQDAQYYFECFSKYIFKYAIYIGDINDDQLLLQYNSDGNTIKIIDGLGTRWFGIKLLFVMYAPWLFKCKIKRRLYKIKMNYGL